MRRALLALALAGSAALPADAQVVVGSKPFGE